MNTKRDTEIFKLIAMVKRALDEQSLETGSTSITLPLNDVITLDTDIKNYGNLEVYAVTPDSAVAWKDDERISFFRFDLDDIYTLQDIIHDEYDIEL